MALEYRQKQLTSQGTIFTRDETAVLKQIKEDKKKQMRVMLEQQIAEKHTRQEREAMYDEKKTRSFSKGLSPFKEEIRHLYSSSDFPQPSSISVIDGDSNAITNKFHYEHRPLFLSPKVSKDFSLKNEINDVYNTLSANKKVNEDIESKLNTKKKNREIPEEHKAYDKQKITTKAGMAQEANRAEQSPIKATMPTAKMVGETKAMHDPIDAIINDGESTMENKIKNREWDEMKKKIEALSQENTDLKDALRNTKHQKLISKADTYEQNVTQEEPCKQENIEESISRTSEKKHSRKHEEKQNVKKNKSAIENRPRYNDQGTNLDAFCKSKFVYPSAEGELENIGKPITYHKKPLLKVMTRKPKEGREKFHHFTKLPSKAIHLIGHQNLKK